MKKVLLLGTLILSLICCSKSSSNKVVDEIKYESFKKYENVSYYFDNYARCHILYIEYKGNDDQGYVINKEYTWVVYLDGYYLQDCWSSLLICTTKNGQNDYYLFAER